MDHNTPQSAEKSPESGNPWYVYLLRCADGSLYAGVSNDLSRRLRQHNGDIAGGARYTRGRRPVQIVWREVARDRVAAQRREQQIKRFTRRQKEQLIAGR